MESWSIEQIAVAAIGAILALGLMLTMLLTNASITPRRFAGILCLAFAYAMIVWALGGAVFPLSRAVTFVATCASLPANVGASVHRLQASEATSVLLLDLGNGVCDARAIATAASLPQTSVSVAFVGAPSDQAEGPNDPLGSALRKAVREAANPISVSTIVILYDAAEPWWDREFVTALRDRMVTERLAAELYFADVKDSGQAYALQLNLIGTLQPVTFNTIANPVQLRLTGGSDISALTQDVDLCFALDAPVGWPECVSRNDVLVLENVSLRQIAPGVAAWEWQGSGVNPFQDLIFDGVSAGIRRCIPGCDKGLAAMKLPTGWHTLRVLARIRVAGQTVTVAPVHHVVFVGSTGATVIVGATETLATRAWPAPTPPGGFARPLLDAAIANTTGSTKLPELARLKAFPRPPSIPSGLPLQGDCILRTDAPTAVLSACLDAARAVMIVEPEPSFLRAFADDAVRLLKRGTAITVAGVPDIDPSDALAAAKWLPAWPASGTGVVETRHQLVLLADCSGLAQMTNEDTASAMANPDSPRAFTDQRAIIDSLKARLQAMPNVVSVALGPPESQVIRFENQSAWQSSTTVGFAPGCLRDMTDEILNQRELVASAVLEQRIDAFVPSGTETVRPPHPTFRLDGTRYPGSAIVVFATQAAQYKPFKGPLRRSGGAAAADELTANWNADLPPAHLLDRLEQSDIKVVIVQLPTNSRFKAAADAELQPGELTWEAALVDWKTHGNVVVVTHNANADPAATGGAILRAIERPPASLHREQFGRIMDPRVSENVAVVPEAFRPLTSQARAGRRLQVLGPEYDNALLAAERNDLGAPVVALAYSPFDPTSWASDIASLSALSDDFTAVCNNPCPMEGWLAAFLARTDAPGLKANSSALGIQRYLDLAAQSRVMTSRPNSLVLDAFALSPAGDQLTARFRLPSVGAVWADPTIDVPAAASHCGPRAGPSGCPMVLATIDAGTGTVTYTFSTTVGLPTRVGGYPIRVVAPPTGQPEEIVHFWLAPRQELSPSATPFLNAMRAAGAVRATPPLPKAQLSALPIAAFVLSFLTFVLFTPIVRPWHAVGRLWRRRRPTDTAATFDVDFVSELAGARPAEYEASRRAGDPAFTRRMQAGDSLSRAVIGDLALLTRIGRGVGAVPQLPRVRLRELGESFDVVIAIDDAPGLLLPGDIDGHSRKRFAAMALVSVISGTVTRQRGRFSIVALRGSTSFREIDQFDSEMIETIFDELFRDGGSRDTIRSPAELPPTAVRVIVSDFLSGTAAQYAAWTQGAHSAAIHILDPNQGTEIGIGRDPRTGRIFDRSVWEIGDAAMLIRQRATDMRYALEQSGATYVAIDVEMSNVEVAALLSESGMLNLTRQR